MGIANDVDRIKRDVYLRVAEKGGMRDEVPRAIRLELDQVWKALERIAEEIEKG